MAESRRYALGAQLDIEQILLEAQNRWLRPAEICEILRNYKNFQIAPEPANKPPNGSLFLFDRKVLRYFRKDGHNWRKKKDGKTVKEAHERLKAGSIDVLHCYYAHGEGNENFQRRSYWLLEEDLSHIVLVHYREVKGNRTNYNRIKEVQESTPNSQETEDNISHSEADSSVSSKFQSFNYPVASQTTDTASLNSTQASEYEDAESAYNQQSSSRGHSFLELQPPVMQKMDGASSVPYYPNPFSNDYQGKVPTNPQMDFVSLTQGGKGKDHSNVGLTYEHQKHFDIQSWENVLGNYNGGVQSASFQPSFQQSLSSTQPNNASVLSGQGNEMVEQVLLDAFGKTQQFGGYSHGQETWQASENDPSNMYKWSMDRNSQIEGEYDIASRFQGGEVSNVDFFNSLETTNPTEQQKHLLQDNLQTQLANAEGVNALKPDLDGKASLRPHFLEGFMKEGLKKLDSFDRWMSKELGDVKEPQLQSTSGAYWEEVESENEVNASSGTPQVDLHPYILSPSLSQDQLFSIIDFSPSWAYAGSKIKVLVTGRFLKSQQDLQNCKWACMFGEVEVPADVVGDGVLRCHTPPHGTGTVPFYVTCSNRLACSEVREFEFQVDEIRDMDAADMNGDSSNEILLHMRFGKFLSLTSAGPQGSVADNPNLMSKINSLIQEDDSDWDQMFKLTSEDEFSTERVRDQLLQKLLKEKLHAWLLCKVAEGGKGPSVVDEGGQGVLHFAAALGYDWAIPPTVAAGVSINFRDVNGWTALHWAAFCGRERTVSFLISRGAAAGVLTDPTPKYPSGRTPADLAASSGHKGIAGYLAEAALSSHLESLKLKDGKEKVVHTVCERTPTPVTDGDYPQGLSLKDSLAAVCNATQAAARIHQVFRVQSFQKKQLKEYGDSKFGLSDERALSLLALKTNKAGLHDEPVHAAATRIQNKFRSWKGRKDFLIIRQRIVKIQAHVRGHQVRKNYRKIVWSVGILDKVILRWRRKGRGLSGFKPEALPEASDMVNASEKDDDDDFLKKGRKQTEERLQKALARVKSMVQYPEARDQYRRLLNAVNDMKDTTVVSDVALGSSLETTDFDDDLIDLEALLDDDDIFMS